MHEFIEVRFHKPNGARLRVVRQLPGGIEFDEPDPLERTVAFSIRGRSEVTRYRMRRIAQIKGWEAGTFQLRVAVEGGSLVLRGDDPDSLPEGDYTLRVRVEDVTARQASTAVRLPHDGQARLDVEIRPDDRDVEVDLTGGDSEIRRVLDASTLDGQPASAWLDNAAFRPTRKACLLNLLATLRVRPTSAAPLIGLVHGVFMAFNDRAYMTVDRALLTRVEALVQDPARPFYREGEPLAPIHGRLKELMPEPPEVKARFGTPLSFRAEGRAGTPSLQMVILPPPVDLAHTYAEFDLDLGNPLQDVLGFVVHAGELLDGRTTNHLDLRARLARTPAGSFLHYRVTATA